MNRYLKILLGITLCFAVWKQDIISEYLGFGQVKHQEEPINVKQYEEEPISIDKPPKGNYFINDSLYRWHDQLLDWVPVKNINEFYPLLTSNVLVTEPLSEPIEIKWEELMDIGYRLRYFEELEMEIYAPVFPEAIKKLNGKEIIVEGYIIPFDEEEELLSLSYNPYASCFFCGKASPASVISMYLKDKGSRYKMDDFKKFRGVLYLNYDDPNEFYYILREAREE